MPRQLPSAFYSEALELRNKLLRWRFENFFRIQSDESQLLDLEPRLTQIGAPLYSVSTDDGFRTRLLKFLADQAEDQHAERPMTIVAEAIRRLLTNQVNWPATLAVKDVADRATVVSTDWVEVAVYSPKRTGTLVRGLGFPTRRTGAGYQLAVPKAKHDEMIARYGLGSGPGGKA